MHLLYNISIYIYLFAIRVASLFNPKARLWIAGRKHIFNKLKSSFLNPGSSDTIWIHCASLGEFEQGRPIIEGIKLNNSGTKIILTFFSPSGYEIRKNYDGADFVFYLPIDTFSNVTRFLDIVKPKTAFFVKYEFWFNYLNELKKRNIPTYLVSGIFRDEHYFFKLYGGWFRKQLNCFTRFFVQDEHSKELLNSINYQNVTVAGDTRFDRVYEIAKNVKIFPLIEQFKENDKIFIAGSTWNKDEEIISDSGLEGFRLIIAPHEINEERISSVEAKFSGICLRYSKANERNIKTARVLIIDNVGMLSSLYQYGTIAFIGGGFGKGIHNILEAATFGLPVIFGPNYNKFTEAKELINRGGAFSVTDKNDFQKIILLLQDDDILKTASHISKHYVQNRIGATSKILDIIEDENNYPKTC